MLKRLLGCQLGGGIDSEAARAAVTVTVVERDFCPEYLGHAVFLSEQHPSWPPGFLCLPSLLFTDF